jgi:hypothetical protein
MTRKEAVMRIGVAAFAVFAAIQPGLAMAEAWQTLDGPAITAALSARVLGYPDGTLQDFFADGQTLSGESRGHWEVRGDQYCSIWPPSERWTCYQVDQSGLDIRFTDTSGVTTIGRYVDLQ